MLIETLAYSHLIFYIKHEPSIRFLCMLLKGHAITQNHIYLYLDKPIAQPQVKGILFGLRKNSSGFTDRLLNIYHINARCKIKHKQRRSVFCSVSCGIYDLRTLARVKRSV